MASMNSPVDRTREHSWNEAHDRLVAYLKTFELDDHVYVSRLALQFLQQARDVYKYDSSRDPTTLTLDLAQKNLVDWLAKNLESRSESKSHVLATGYIALLLSKLYRDAPDSFLAPTVPDDVRQSLRQTLIVTGPDLNISSMTPRHLDYGPMLQFARQTWHRFEPKELIIAILFWVGVYTVFYWWLSQVL